MRRIVRSQGRRDPPEGPQPEDIQPEAPQPEDIQPEAPQQEDIQPEAPQQVRSASQSLTCFLAGATLGLNYLNYCQSINPFII